MNEFIENTYADEYLLYEFLLDAYLMSLLEESGAAPGIEETTEMEVE